jgi:hypothetical protein
MLGTGMQQAGNLGQLGSAQAQAQAARQQNVYASQEVRKPSLLADSNRLIERLIEISAKSERFADMLCGHAPTPISDQPGAKLQGAPTTETNLRFNLDSAMRWVERIEVQLMRIDNGL